MRNFKFLLAFIVVWGLWLLICLGVRIGSDLYLESKKRQCWSDIYTIQDIYNKEHRYISLYFYSPKLKTCLYWGFTVTNYENDNRTATLTLMKLYTNEKLEEIKFCESKQDCDNKINNEVLKSIEIDKFRKLTEKYK